MATAQSPAVSPASGCPIQHHCNECFVCDAADAQLILAQQPQHSADSTITACLATHRTAVAAPSCNVAWECPLTEAPPSPAALHAITLPLLD